MACVGILASDYGRMCKRWANICKRPDTRPLPERPARSAMRQIFIAALPIFNTGRRRRPFLAHFGNRFWQELDSLNQGKQPWFYFLHVWALHMPLPSPWREKLIYQFPGGPILAGFQWLDLALLARLWSVMKGRRQPIASRLSRVIKHWGVGRDGLRSSAVSLCINIKGRI